MKFRFLALLTMLTAAILCSTTSCSTTDYDSRLTLATVPTDMLTSINIHLFNSIGRDITEIIKNYMTEQALGEFERLVVLKEALFFTCKRFYTFRACDKNKQAVEEKLNVATSIRFLFHPHGMIFYSKSNQARDELRRLINLRANFRDAAENPGMELRSEKISIVQGKIDAVLKHNTRTLSPNDTVTRHRFNTILEDIFEIINDIFARGNLYPSIDIIEDSHPFILPILNGIVNSKYIDLEELLVKNSEINLAELVHKELTQCKWVRDKPDLFVRILEPKAQSKVLSAIERKKLGLTNHSKKKNTQAQIPVVQNQTPKKVSRMELFRTISKKIAFFSSVLVIFYTLYRLLVRIAFS